MDETSGYEIVQLRNGAHSVRSLAHGETMHVGMGPAAEAHALYVEQADLAARLRGHTGEFVVWDVGLGAAANALAVLRAAPRPTSHTTNSPVCPRSRAARSACST